MLSTIWASKSRADAIRKKYFINPEYIISFEILQGKVYLNMSDGSIYVVHNTDDMLEASYESETIEKIYNEFYETVELDQWVENAYEHRRISELQYDIPEEW